MHDRFAALGDPVRAAAATDRAMYLPDDLLTKVDRASMLHALEVRSPFMDPDVVTFAAGLTTDQLLKGGPKRMLREAFADDLPAWVFKRKKMGFAVPIGEWFRGELRAIGLEPDWGEHFLERPVSQKPEDLLLVQMQGVIAEYERAKILERTRRGRLHKVRNGQMLPFYIPPYGYRVVRTPQLPQGMVVLDEVEAEQVRQMYHWVLEENRKPPIQPR